MANRAFPVAQSTLFHAHAPMTENQGKVILLVDDQNLVAAAVRSLLAEQTTWKVHHVALAAEAVEAAARLRPHVILQDMILPDGSGLDLIGRYAQVHELPGTQVIMLSVDETPEHKAAAFDAGAFDYIVKMPAKAEFVVRVRHAIRQAEMVEAQVCLLDQAEAANRQARRELEARREAERKLEALNLRLRQELHARMEALERIAADLGQIQDLDLLLRRLLAEAREVFGCEAGSILLREGDTLVFTYAQNDIVNAELRFPDPRRSPAKLPIDRSSLAGAAAVDGLVAVRDAYELPEDSPFQFNKSFDQATGFRTRAVLALAMHDRMHQLIGVLQLINPRDTGSHHSREFSEDDQKLARHFAVLAADQLDRVRSYREAILRMVRLSELNDPKETGAHVRRVAEVSAILYEAWARRRGASEREIDRQLDMLRSAAMLHDLGKVGIPDLIKKSGPLTADERKEMQKHPILGVSIYREIHDPVDRASVEVMLYHQTKWDGSGYPSHDEIRQQLVRLGWKPEHVPEPKHEGIPIFGRVSAVADVFDALMSRRAYKEPWDSGRVRDEMARSSGTHFDPELVEILLERFDQVCAAHAMFEE
jgi:response regulator RpfG family c-di-GMP phosphodiesterase